MEMLPFLKCNRTKWPSLCGPQSARDRFVKLSSNHSPTAYRNFCLKVFFFLLSTSASRKKCKVVNMRAQLTAGAIYIVPFTLAIKGKCSLAHVVW